ncbi:uncharacterized protein Y057_8571 [Fusarium fujikuroi]|nr:uncharacterized protein Y057_8571 [Fusarium fujikuroi]SCN65858.1 uncharacterized protein FFE2_00108 [Fusarium fujikuroi]SCN68791.1 uncharacterized protein FFC1_00105 [Fusarium fujikuroi]
MHLSILRLLAVGLAGIDDAVAGPCKLRSSVATSSFDLSSDTSATFASTTTEAVTSADTVTDITTEVTSAVIETETASTEATASGDTTTEATTFATSTATTEAASTTGADTTTEAAPTTTEETTTAAATTTAVPMFRLIPESSNYQGQPLLSNRVHFASLLFNGAQEYTDAYFTIGATTGRLLLDGTLPICGYFPGDGTSAFIVCDATNMPDEEQYLTCETPTPGSRLECTVPEVQCSMSSGCTATGTLWGTTYVGPSGGELGMKALIGPPSMPEDVPVPLLVTFDSDYINSAQGQLSLATLLSDSERNYGLQSFRDIGTQPGSPGHIDLVGIVCRAATAII